MLIALAVGGIIGLERSYHGRPAGFRTHALVCVASSLLMLVTVYESEWFTPSKMGRVTVDPTRMAQGIMTGIGFLGAGVIMKDGLSVRGLTTAASIWITAAIGILAGVGFYFPVAVATVMTLGTLSLFRWIEARMPSQLHAYHTVRFARASSIAEAEYRKIMAEHGFSIANLSYRVDREKNYLEYRMMIRTRDHNNAQHLSKTLSALESVLEFRISPTGD
ncbi:MAG TPA: MgtC/SapB family protein [Burkholderiales bacterium]|nr:MgtC/SapB family protein [Burkholderiales bacterium]